MTQESNSSLSKIFLGAFFLFSTPYANAYTMRELYEKALEASELVQSAQLDVRIEESDRTRTAKELNPEVTLNADGTYHVNKYDREGWENSRTLGVRTEFRQPIYDGGRTKAALSVADATIEASQWDVKTEEQALYLRVAGLFYEWILQSQDIKNLEETTRVLERRVKDLSAWEKIGRSRNAEVFAARTQLELIRGLIAQSRTNRNAAEEELAWLTKLPTPLKLEDQLTLAKIRPKSLANQRKADDSEPNYKLPTVEAAEARVRAAERTIELTRTDLKPNVDFIAQHQWSYLDATDQGYNDFAIGVGLSWLLWDDGQVNAAVTTANLIKTRAAVARELADREARLSLGLLNRRLEDSLAQIRSYQAALDVVEKTENAQRQEYESGLITNLELLTVLDQRLEIRRNLDLALNRAKLIFVQSEVYSGDWLKQTSNSAQ